MAFFLQCLSPTKATVILTKLHDGSVGGHYGSNTTIKNIFITTYRWPTVQQTSQNFASFATFVND
jgi:hypothetical protein